MRGPRPGWRGPLGTHAHCFRAEHLGGAGTRFWSAVPQGDTPGQGPSADAAACTEGTRLKCPAVRAPSRAHSIGGHSAGRPAGCAHGSQGSASRCSGRPVPGEAQTGNLRERGRGGCRSPMRKPRSYTADLASRVTWSFPHRPQHARQTRISPPLAAHEQTCFTLQQRPGLRAQGNQEVRGSESDSRSGHTPGLGAPSSGPLVWGRVLSPERRGVGARQSCAPDLLSE